MAFQQRYRSHDRVKDFDFDKQHLDFFSHDLPQVHLSEDKEKYYLRVLIAGLGSDDFSLNFKENQLEIEVNFSSPSGKYLIQERAVGTFNRRIDFSSCIVRSEIVSEFSNGLLYIELPKKEDKEIIIQSQEISDEEGENIEIKLDEGEEV